MGSMIENVTITDSNALSNMIMHELNDVERMESMLDMELTSDELFRIDCAILSSLKETQDFSKDLLKQLESGLLEELAEIPIENPEGYLEKIQMNALSGLNMPIRDMFDEIEDFVVDALISC